MTNKFDTIIPKLNSGFRPSFFHLFDGFFGFLFEISHALGCVGVSGAELGFELLPGEVGVVLLVADAVGCPAV